MNRITERKIQAAAYHPNQELYQFSREVYGYDVNSRLDRTWREEDGGRLDGRSEKGSVPSIDNVQSCSLKDWRG
jgi:hypothetical protein